MRRLDLRRPAQDHAPMSIRLALCLLLICASFAVAARDVRQAGANGDGGSCPQELSATVEDPAPAPPAHKREPATDKAAQARGGDGQALRAPRWHSFLPGMFR